VRSRWYQAAIAAVPGLFTAVIIFGGVLGGVFTPTESSAVAVIYTAVIAFVVYRTLGLRDFVKAAQNAVKTTAMIMLIIGTAAAFGWLLALNEAPARLAEGMAWVSDNPIIILLMINIILLVLGTFMDMAPMIIICTPIFLPVVTAFGVDPIHFGVILILNAGIGLNTPPVGSVQFVACAVGKISIGESMKTIWPFYGASVAVLLLVTYVPAFSLWLPSVFN